MGTFDTEQRLEHVERELKELRSLLNAAAVVGIPSSDMRPGAKITDVLAAHGHALTAIMRRLDALESEIKHGPRLG